MPPKNSEKRTNPLIALTLAWLVPGAGHVYVGRLTRGLVIFVVVLGMFWSGVAMGGALTVNRAAERWWFIADMFAGISGLAAWRISEHTLDLVLEEEDLAPPVPPETAGAFHRNTPVDAALAERNLALTAPTATVARAYAGVAGLMNLMCIFDAVLLSLMGRYGEPAGPQVRGERTGEESDGDDG